MRPHGLWGTQRLGCTLSGQVGLPGPIPSAIYYHLKPCSHPILGDFTAFLPSARPEGKLCRLKGTWGHVCEETVPLHRSLGIT